MSFKQIIQGIHTISKCFRNGLQALGSNSSKLKPADTRNCKGSIDIDSCLATSSPNESRWDYMVGYDRKVYFIEVHPAYTSEVDTVINKLVWLKDWLNQDGLPIKLGFESQNMAYYWIASGKITILKNSVYARRLAQSGLDIPKSYLKLQ